MSHCLTIKKVSQMLGVCPATIYNRLKDTPEFPQPIKIGRCTRWNPEEVDDYMSKKAPRGVDGKAR